MSGERVVLVGGLWLSPDVWDSTVAELDARDRRAVAVALPGQGDGNTTATLDDQVAAVVAAVDADPQPSIVVGHSAAGTLAWLAADARPDKVSKVVLIGGFPSDDGEKYADLFEPVGGAMAFPGWAAFEGPDSDDIDEDTRRSMAGTMIPVPVGVSRGVVRLTDERRYAVPVVMICPEFSPEQAREWIDAGDLPELARAEHVEMVDIDSGHWPMVTRPKALAEILAEL